ncbi:LacI family DNA-binding transcriptional regulator [Daejeonella lutea]|uniref:Transcriptional regulator, LacI family n=1 Tax=Daejeonella lutea TaxID=572036 RepID=A0A1T5AE79_9SPHI|nr:LacI family DNA-binding transcriptional regulator [Daejeonella lutea]SKB33342.1 transcriptional regulator, LacI family [Daejeonella lutea]
MKNINIKDLARELNLSVGTISKAFHDSYEISEDTKNRVLETARRLNYVPNPYASSLRGRRSKNIAVVIPEVADSFFSLAINGIESVAKEKGYHVLICLTHESFENEKTILQEFQGGRVDGVLMSVSRETSESAHILNLMGNGVPLVFFDRVLDEIDTAKITTDDFESGYKATEHLIQQGCDNIGFLGISECLSISNRRLEGYQKALNDYHVRYDSQQIINCTNDAVQNDILIRELLQGPNRPNGIVATVEKLTTPVYRASEALGLNIPADLKFVCFSNLETASILNPSLTTITQPAFEMGKIAATLLFKSLEKNDFNLSKESQVVPSRFIMRGSTI